METRRRLVEYEHHVAFGALLRQERSELHALALAARKRRGGLSEPDIPQPDLLQRTEPLDDPFAGGVFLLLAEEGDRIVHRHLQYVVDRLFAVADFENLILEALAAAGFAHQLHVGHELHADLDESLALALLAAAAGDVEREVRGVESRPLGVGLVGVEFADLVVGLDVGHGVRPRGFADRVLIDHFDRTKRRKVAFDGVEIARFEPRIEQQAPQCGIEDAFGQRRFAAAAHARDAGHHPERNPHVDILQVVLPGTFHGDPRCRASPRGGHCDFAASRKVVGRQAFFLFQ